MLTKKQYQEYVNRALEYYEKAHIVLTQQEKDSVEVVDWGLNEVETNGLEIITYINTDRVCAKEMVLFPGQTCAEHWHVDTDGMQGKEETFRCRYGKVYLYVDGEPTENIKAKLPTTKTTVRHEVVLNPGEQYTIMPYTKHWFQAGEEGAVISEFSTRSTDETDCFTDERLVRATVIED
ncbi:MAG: D-lyxose/D-mannose family sugar isomerase [Clostridia bacterium]|jgi:D-lyxose ketol-isomerase|nr:D-lyxose/D-mannose family sugar isomerase [Clostridia bacterium]MBQ1942113.1 D-lyxose/D-mannose family sugar isomerase [Clostridia bacterium]